MAKRSTTTVRQRHTLTEICAFWGMTIAALMYLFSGFINFLIKVIKSLNGTKTAATLSQICSIFQLLGNIAIIIAIALPAYSFVRYKSRSWKIFYWIMLAVFAFGVVFGMLGSIL